jgi:hypothetical protein
MIGVATDRHCSDKLLAAASRHSAAAGSTYRLPGPNRLALDLPVLPLRSPEREAPLTFTGAWTRARMVRHLGTTDA